MIATKHIINAYNFYRISSKRFIISNSNNLIEISGALKDQNTKLTNNFKSLEIKCIKNTEMKCIYTEYKEVDNNTTTLDVSKSANIIEWNSKKIVALKTKKDVSTTFLIDLVKENLEKTDVYNNGLIKKSNITNAFNIKNLYKRLKGNNISY